MICVNRLVAAIVQDVV